MWFCARWWPTPCAGNAETLVGGDINFTPPRQFAFMYKWVYWMLVIKVPLYDGYVSSLRPVLSLCAEKVGASEMRRVASLAFDVLREV